MEYVDMTPTWSDVIDIYIMALERGGEAGKRSAREEIRRLARQYDAIVAELELEAA